MAYLEVVGNFFLGLGDSRSLLFTGESKSNLINKNSWEQKRFVLTPRLGWHKVDPQMSWSFRPSAWSSCTPPWFKLIAKEWNCHRDMRGVPCRAVRLDIARKLRRTREPEKCLMETDPFKQQLFHSSTLLGFPRKHHLPWADLIKAKILNTPYLSYFCVRAIATERYAIQVMIPWSATPPSTPDIIHRQWIGLRLYSLVFDGKLWLRMLISIMIVSWW